MGPKLYSLPLMFSLVVLFACEPGQTETPAIAAKIEGRWSVEEYSSELKSANDFYFVTIGIYPGDSNKVIIKNFYDLGSDNSNVSANINGMKLIIPKQTTDEGSTVEGSGVISSKFDKINWTYSINIGDDELHEITATYTRSY
jgi:hypothetical protein